MTSFKRTDNWATGVTATLTPEQELLPDEAHFYTCADCGQAVDMRDLGDVFHHEEPGHDRIPNDD